MPHVVLIKAAFARIRRAGDEFIAAAFQGNYLAAHCRRTDFLRVRVGTTPAPQAIVAQINNALQIAGLDQVFVATDDPKGLQELLHAEVRGNVKLLHSMPEIAERFQHPGQKAAVEMWIAARSAYFLGTQESRFSSHIQLERSWMGKPKESSEQEFCRDWPSVKQCRAPAYRHSDRKGKQHHAYWE